MAKLELNVSIADEGRFDATLKQAQAAGLKVTRSFKDLGVASGVIESGKLAQLRRVPGLNIEENRDVSIEKIGP